MTIEEVMSKAAKYAGLTAAAIHSDTPENNRMEESAFDELRAAVQALVAQARDEEAEACLQIVEGAVMRAVDSADALAAIRARIAARAGREA